MVTKAAVIGIDLGTLDSVAGYVGKGIVDIVQNELSQRKTATLVSFTDQQRLLGDQALAQIKSNFKNSCRNFLHLLGRGMNAPDLEREIFWSPSELVPSEDLQYVGYKVKYLSAERIFSCTQILAMFLTKIREITEAWCGAKVADIVIAIPGYFTDSHRHAVLDAAKIANLHVLRLINEHTATSLAYGIYRSNDFDAEAPTTVAFASMGHSTFSLAIVQFIKGKLKVLSEASDRFCGGRYMDEAIIRYFAADFEKKYRVDPLKNKKSLIKMEDAVQKTKKVLSSNVEANIGVECLVEDFDLSGRITRDIFEELCAPLIQRVEAVIQRGIEESGLSADSVQFVEIVGGASRVPWVQRIISNSFADKELSKTINADESVARGAALQAAILSPLYKVRDFEVCDTSAHSVSIGWIASDVDNDGTMEEDKEPEAHGDGKEKTAVVFPAGSQFNTLKVLTFYRKGSFDIFAKYTDSSNLIEGTSEHLGTYRIDLAPQSTVKKVKVRAKLTIHGTFDIESAHIVEEEDYEEVTRERKEIPDTEQKDEPMPQADENATTTNDEGAAEKKETPEKKEEKKEKKYETIEVKTMKKRTKKTNIPIAVSGVARLSEETLQIRRDEETAIYAHTRGVREKEEKRNDVESYIYEIRDKLTAELAPFAKPQEKQTFLSALEAAENWLYDLDDADTAVYSDKLIELKAYGDPIKYRHSEKESRAEWVPHLQETIQNYRMAAQSPSEDYAHIAPEKKQQIVSDCNAAEAWLQALLLQQQKLADFDDVVLKAFEIQKKSEALQKTSDAILSEPKPVAKPEETAAPVPTENAEAPKDKPADMDVDSTN